MANTKDLQELIDEIHERNERIERDYESEQVYYDKMLKLYDRYIETNDKMTRRYKLSTYIFLGVLVTACIGLFVLRVTS